MRIHPSHHFDDENFPLVDFALYSVDCKEKLSSCHPSHHFDEFLSRIHPSHHFERRQEESFHHQNDERDEFSTRGEFSQCQSTRGEFLQCHGTLQCHAQNPARSSTHTHQKWNFSKVGATVILYRKFGNELTFENSWEFSPVGWSTYSVRAWGWNFFAKVSSLLDWLYTKWLWSSSLRIFTKTDG